MAKTRIINTRFWIDDYTSNLDPIEKLLFLYFLTNTATEICGAYELPLKVVAVETGIEKEMVEKIIGRFTRDKKIFYVEGWVWITNFTKHQIKNPSVEQGIERCFNDVPDKITNKINELLQNGDSVRTATPQQGLPNLTKPNLTKPTDIYAKDPKFIKFWDSYPKKKCKDEAYRVWKKINNPPLEEMVKALELAKNSNDWKKEDGQFIPYPATWLNRGQWKDELPLTEEEKLWNKKT